MNAGIKERVVARFLRGFKYEPKESKQTKVEKLRERIREQSGVGRGVAEDIADAIIRGRDLEALGHQKGWPVNDDGLIEGPKGTFDPKSS